MTHEEFCKIMDNSNFMIDSNNPYDIKILEALEKQIPKKPLHMHKNYYCPTCKEDGWMLWDDAVPNDMDRYCGKCGQAIDWSDEG